METSLLRLVYGLLEIQGICNFTSRDMGFYQILLPWIWTTVFNIFVTFRDAGNFENY